jgi:hypothetical protein
MKNKRVESTKLQNPSGEHLLRVCSVERIMNKEMENVWKEVVET